ncbi:tyrosine-type recombinase/integrase [Elizabethkingia anophelis]|uniref:tyrosine-type recombinase/integrase n=1 Tax=Elizabethkingia anophelis TaxID=1117645 RepID=UPI002012D922|nr:site-specific integrase [Elizabethkingia anophelis]MCL1690828.1 site-specific integrase [Elizabethkingia anophelis]
MTTKFTEIIVTPSNWRTGSKSDLLSKNWIISYYFYTEEFPRGKQIRIKGMNRAKNLEEKRILTKQLIANEIRLLESGYNPITKHIELEEGCVNSKTPFIDALKLALKELPVVEGTIKDIDNSISHVAKGAKAYGWEYTPIIEIGKREIKLILNWLTKNNRSNYKVNKVRANLSSLFKYFVEIDIFDVNFIHGISKLKHTVKEREIIRTDDEREAFGKLKELNYNLWRFATIFYYSGCRLEEILRVKVEDINLDKQHFFILQKKGGEYIRMMKPINFQILYLWKELLKEAKKSHFLFGSNLSPDEISTTRNAITHKWKLWAKNKLGIKCDLYALKHTFLNDLTKAYGISTAKDIAGHTNEKTTMIYAIDYKESLVDKQKMVNVKL